MQRLNATRFLGQQCANVVHHLTRIHVFAYVDVPVNDAEGGSDLTCVRLCCAAAKMRQITLCVVFNSRYLVKRRSGHTNVLLLLALRTAQRPVVPRRAFVPLRAAENGGNNGSVPPSANATVAATSECCGKARVSFQQLHYHCHLNSSLYSFEVTVKTRWIRHCIIHTCSGACVYTNITEIFNQVGFCARSFKKNFNFPHKGELKNKQQAGDLSLEIKCWR